MELRAAGIGQVDSDREGDWLRTFTGRRFWPMDPRPEEMDIRDIAHSLALQTRYAGHCAEPFSIAQHCVIVGLLCTLSGEGLWGLLHDASEAYLCDLPRPLKRHPDLFRYRAVEDQLQHALFQRFGLPSGFDAWGKVWMPESVHHADTVALRTEARDLMGDPQDWQWPEGIRPLPLPIEVWNWRKAEEQFLFWFDQWGGRR